MQTARTARPEQELAWCLGEGRDGWEAWSVERCVGADPEASEILWPREEMSRAAVGRGGIVLLYMFLSKSWPANF
jgi:hypothetical protein